MCVCVCVYVCVCVCVDEPWSQILITDMKHLYKLTSNLSFWTRLWLNKCCHTSTCHFSFIHEANDGNFIYKFVGFWHFQEPWGRLTISVETWLDPLHSCLLVHVLQAGEDHDAVGQTALHQEMERVPAERQTPWMIRHIIDLTFIIF